MWWTVDINTQNSQVHLFQTLYFTIYRPAQGGTYSMACATSCYRQRLIRLILAIEDTCGSKAVQWATHKHSHQKRCLNSQVVLDLCWLHMLNCSFNVICWLICSCKFVLSAILIMSWCCARLWDAPRRTPLMFKWWDGILHWNKEKLPGILMPSKVMISLMGRVLVMV